MFQTTYTVRVLSEQPIPEQLRDDLGFVVEQCDTGDYVGGIEKVEVSSLTDEEMARALVAIGSEPGFFGLEDDGTRVS